jgi:hypothetical protein
LLKEEIKFGFDFSRNRIAGLLWQSHNFFLEGTQRFFSGLVKIARADFEDFSRVIIKVGTKWKKCSILVGS